MKTEEDEAFDELARKQGDWGGGFQAKRKMAADKDALFEKLEVEQPAQEPFGYFKAEPFGWTDCAETDEGAKALYEAPPKREWIWLSDADIKETIDSICQYNGDYDEWLCKKIERKIKELNT